MLYTTNKKYLYLFLAFWFILNCITAYFTELSNDEAYYWVYSRYLDWGYFDHPPMVALMDFLGYAVLQNELGVRIVAITMMTISLWRIYEMSMVARPLLFALIACSVFVVNLFGFISLPDIPLFFFSVLFFEFYKKYLKEDNFKNSVTLMILIACMLYSKYHGILIVFFTVLSNLSLFRKKSFYTIIIGSIILFVPHLLWQITHDLPSIKYHLFGRDTSPYSVDYTFEYIIGHPIYYGPLMGFLMIFFSLKYKTTDLFDKALKYNFAGIFIFFLLSTFKGRVEANWTICALIPMLIFSMRYTAQNLIALKWLTWIGLVSLFLMIFLRVQLLYPLVQFEGDRTEEFRGWRKFTDEVMIQSNELPVLATTYQKAAKLSFYSGKMISSINVNGRRNQYDFWRMDDSLIGRRVILVNHWLQKGKMIVSPQQENIYLTVIDSLPIFKHLELITEKREYIVSTNEALDIRLELSNNTNHPIKLIYPLAYPTSIKCVIYKDGVYRSEVNDYTIHDRAIASGFAAIDKPLFHIVKIKAPLEKGDYVLKFNIRSENIGDWQSGPIVKLKVN